MNPNDEIQKYIRSELKILADYDSKNKNFQISQIDNFRNLSAFLNDLVASIESEYIKANILENRATIEVSNEKESLSCISWNIQPNFKIDQGKEEYWKTNLWQKKVNLEQIPGFKVQEKRGDGGEKDLEFGAENEVISYLAQEIAKRVAFYRYRKNI